jgi:hypothetical protein
MTQLKMVADFASLIAKVKSNYSVEGPVVAFGGSYGTR